MSASAKAAALSHTIIAIREGALSDYKTMVATLANGAEVETSDLVSVCLVAGRSLDEMKSDVDRLATRRELVAKLATVPELSTAALKASGEVEQLRKERSLTLRLLDSKIEIAAAASAEANRLLSLASEAATKLRSTADPALKDQLSALATEQRAASAKLRELRERETGLAADAEVDIPPLSDQVREHSDWPPEEADRAARRRDHKAAVEKKEFASGELDRVRSEIGSLTSRVAAIESERAAIDAQTLVP
jgi:hypothetical protein